MGMNRVVIKDPIVKLSNNEVLGLNIILYWLLSYSWPPKDNKLYNKKLPGEGDNKQ